MIKEFNEMPWHDAVLHEVIIDRKNKDIVKIFVKWPNNFSNGNSIIEFVDCYGFRADMNFGIVPPDFILSAKCTQESDDLNNLRHLWERLGVDLKKMYSFEIQTNSTNSVINIFSLGYRLLEVKK